MVGFVNGGPERGKHDEYDGELYAIYLLEAHQRRGTGRLLASALAFGLLESGMNSMLVWVLMESQFRRFYETLGGSFIMEQDIDIGGKTLKEVAYGWEDITTLIKQ